MKYFLAFFNPPPDWEETIRALLRPLDQPYLYDSTPLDGVKILRVPKEETMEFVRRVIGFMPVPLKSQSGLETDELSALQQIMKTIAEEHPNLEEDNLEEGAVCGAKELQDGPLKFMSQELEGHNEEKTEDEGAKDITSSVDVKEIAQGANPLAEGPPRGEEDAKTVTPSFSGLTVTAGAAKSGKSSYSEVEPPRSYVENKASCKGTNDNVKGNEERKPNLFRRRTKDDYNKEYFANSEPTKDEKPETTQAKSPAKDMTSSESLKEIAQGGNAGAQSPARVEQEANTVTPSLSGATGTAGAAKSGDARYNEVAPPRSYIENKASCKGTNDNVKAKQDDYDEEFTSKWEGPKDDKAKGSSKDEKSKGTQTKAPASDKADHKCHSCALTKFTPAKLTSAEDGPDCWYCPTDKHGILICPKLLTAEEISKPDFVLDAFSRTFKMRTSLLKTSLGVSAVFENFAVFKSSSYVKLEAQLMLGKEKFGLFLKNASIFFQAIQKLKPHGPGWMAFIEAMRTVVKDPRELREVYCGGDTLGGTPEKFPHLIIIKRPDNTVEQVIVRIDTNVILGCQDWKEGVEVLVLSYLVFNFNIRKHSNIIKMLARAFFGLKKEKKLTTSCANKLLATLTMI